MTTVTITALNAAGQPISGTFTIACPSGPVIVVGSAVGGVISALLPAGPATLRFGTRPAEAHAYAFTVPETSDPVELALTTEQ